MTAAHIIFALLKLACYRLTGSITVLVADQYQDQPLTTIRTPLNTR